MSRRTNLALIFGLFALGALRVTSVWDQLPSTMASHFGVSGAADGFMGRGGFFLFYGLISTFVTALLLGISVLVAKLPAPLINLPNRDYWLTPERKGVALERMSGAFDRYALATTIFLLGVLELCLRANLSGSGLENVPFLVLLVGYLAYSLVWTVRLYTTFAVPEAR